MTAAQPKKKLRLRREWYSRAFAPVLRSKKRYLILFGGRGSGKTRHIILKLLAATFTNTPVSVYYCRHEFETIRKTTFKDIVSVLKSIPALNTCFKYSESTNGSMTFTNLRTGHQLAPFGLDDPEKTKGISEATHVWIDEIDKCTLEQFQLINSVLRTPRAEYLQFIGSFNPVAERHWLREQFFDPDNAYLPNPAYGDSLQIHHSTVYDNEYIDVEEYVRTLELTYSGNRNLLNVNIKGLWGQEENKAPWLYAFSYDKHVRETLPFYPSYDIHLSFDFNRDPVSCVAVQYSPQMGTPNSFVHFIKEFGGKMQLEELCFQIKTFFPNSIFRVTGDSSGNKGDVTYNSAHDTAYTLIRSALNLSQRQMEPNISNLLHENSRYLCNAMFANYPNLYLSKEGCPNLIADCEIAQTDEKASKPHQLKKDREAFKMDYFDGMRYWFQRYAYEFARVAYLRAQK